MPRPACAGRILRAHELILPAATAAAGHDAGNQDSWTQPVGVRAPMVRSTAESRHLEATLPGFPGIGPGHGLRRSACGLGSPSGAVHLGMELHGHHHDSLQLRPMIGPNGLDRPERRAPGSVGFPGARRPRSAPHGIPACRSAGLRESVGRSSGLSGWWYPCALVPCGPYPHAERTPGASRPGLWGGPV